MGDASPVVFFESENNGLPSSDFSDSGISSSLPSPFSSCESLTVKAETDRIEMFIRTKVNLIIKEHYLDDHLNLKEDLIKASRCIESYRKCTLNSPVWETFGRVQIIGIENLYVLIVDEGWINYFDIEDDSNSVQAQVILKTLTPEERAKTNLRRIKELLMDTQNQLRGTYGDKPIHTLHHDLGKNLTAELITYPNDDAIWVINGREIDIQYPLVGSQVLLLKRQAEKHAKSDDQISLNELENIKQYLQENQTSLIERAKLSQKSIYLRPSVTGLARALMFTADGQVFMMLNRTKVLDKVLGIGSFKKVTVAIEVNTGKFYASYTPLNPRDEKNIRMFARDIQNLEMMTKDNWPDYFPKMIAIAEYQTKDGKHGKTRVIVEFFELGELFRYYKKLDPSQKKVVFETLIQAVAFMHRKGLMHRDIKPENVLLGTCEKTNKFRVVLSDSMLCRIDDLASRAQSCGSPNYVPLEYIQALTQWSKKAKEIRDKHLSKDLEDAALKKLNPIVAQASGPFRDMWALGCTLSATLLNFAPDAWAATHGGELEDLDFTLSQVYGRPNTPKWLIKRMLDLDPYTRISAREAEGLIPKLYWKSGI